MQDNKDLHRFENVIDDYVVFANYGLNNNVLTIKYVEAPPELRGTGAAGKLMEDVMNHARDKGYKVVPICGYAVAWIRRHEEYQDLLAD